MRVVVNLKLLLVESFVFLLLCNFRFLGHFLLVVLRIEFLGAFSDFKQVKPTLVFDVVLDLLNLGSECFFHSV